MLPDTNEQKHDESTCNSCVSSILRKVACAIRKTGDNIKFFKDISITMAVNLEGIADKMDSSPSRVALGKDSNSEKKAGRKKTDSKN